MIRRIYQNETPFLSVVTRTVKRPLMLSRNQESLYAQTDTDFEHIMLIDSVGMGIPATHLWIVREKNRPKGQYIFILDDDEVIDDREFIADMKQVALEHDPDIIMFRTNRMGDILPPDDKWEKRPECGYVGMACFAIKAEPWRLHIEAINELHNAGDFTLLDALFEAGHSVYWHNKIVTRAQQIGGGRVGER